MYKSKISILTELVNFDLIKLNTKYLSAFHF